MRLLVSRTLMEAVRSDGGRNDGKVARLFGVKRRKGWIRRLIGATCDVDTGELVCLMRVPVTVIVYPRDGGTTTMHFEPYADGSEQRRERGKHRRKAKPVARVEATARDVRKMTHRDWQERQRRVRANLTRWYSEDAFIPANMKG